MTNTLDSKGFLESVEKGNERRRLVHEKYKEWFVNDSKTPDIRELFLKIIEYEEEYFSDLTLTDFVDLLYFDDQSDCISLVSAGCRYYVVPDNEPPFSEGIMGQCLYDQDSGDFYIKIPKRELDNKTTIFHEMIHAYQGVINDRKVISRQLLPIYLYDKLAPKIPNLKYYLYLNANRELYQQGHDSLFLLKSFDLDLRVGLPLGSVFAYGREDLIKGLQEQIQNGGSKIIQIEWESTDDDELGE